MYHKTAKGQMSSVDFMLSVIVFIMLLGFVIGTWYTATTSAEDKIKKNSMETAALTASDMLVKSPGVPASWEKNSSQAITMLGLSTSSPNVLSQAKLNNFTNMSYATSKSLLGIDNEFYFYVEALNGTRLSFAGNSTNGTVAIALTRFMLLNGQKVRVRLIVHD